MKILYTSVFILLTALGYGQKSTLFQNVNYRAKELKHTLNKDGDSLMLKAEKTIYKVEIFNAHFEQSILVEGSDVIIPLNDIPPGRFVVQASIPNKLIVLTLLRHQSLDATVATEKPRKKTSLFGATPLTPRAQTLNSEEPVTAPRLIVVDENSEINNANLSDTDSKYTELSANQTALISPHAANAKTNVNLIEENITPKSVEAKKPEDKNVKAYWIVYKTNASYGAGTVKRIGDEALVDKMISTITLDKKTIAGRQNELIIWEIYDISEFVKYKRKRNNDLSDEAECFNNKPFFKV